MAFEHIAEYLHHGHGHEGGHGGDHDLRLPVELFEDEAAFIDLRKDPAWNAGRIPGAIHLDFKTAFSQVRVSQSALLNRFHLA